MFIKSIILRLQFINPILYLFKMKNNAINNEKPALKVDCSAKNPKVTSKIKRPIELENTYKSHSDDSSIEDELDFLKQN